MKGVATMGQTISLRAHRVRNAARTIDVEQLSTDKLLVLHERHFGPLDAKGKRRIAETAATNGWDRSWDLDGLAA
jgi:hypothetical protein